MRDPILVHVTRGPEIESAHRGALAISRADGNLALAIGAVDRPIYPRSAIKVLQAIPLVESGAASHYQLSDRELAIACASHGGEPGHIETVAGVLRKIGLSPGLLACGPHWPTSEAARHALMRNSAEPLRIHNNCSGKHAGMLAVAVHMGESPAGYEGLTHPVQSRLRDLIGEITDTPLADASCAVDGCSVPTWAVPLDGLALAMARLGTGHDLSESRAGACARLLRACLAEPWYVAGSGRFCTAAMTCAGGQAFVKGGAEGVYCGALPGLGLGIALKIADGASRASEVVMATLLAALLPDHRDALAPYSRPAVTNWRGVEVGQITAAPELRKALAVFA